MVNRPQVRILCEFRRDNHRKRIEQEHLRCGYWIRTSHIFDAESEHILFLSCTAIGDVLIVFWSRFSPLVWSLKIVSFVLLFRSCACSESKMVNKKFLRRSSRTYLSQEHCYFVCRGHRCDSVYLVLLCCCCYYSV